MACAVCVRSVTVVSTGLIVTVGRLAPKGMLWAVISAVKLGGALQLVAAVSRVGLECASCEIVTVNELLVKP